MGKYLARLLGFGLSAAADGPAQQRYAVGVLPSADANIASQNIYNGSTECSKMIAFHVNMRIKPKLCTG